MKKTNTVIYYTIATICSFLIEVFVFFFSLHIIFQNNQTSIYIFITVVLSRFISATVNFLLNYKKVFKSSNPMIQAILKFYGLVIINMIITALGTVFLHPFIGNAFVAKLLFDVSLFFINFYIQKYIIFK